MTTTLRSISDYTGLSLPTISQALNNTGRISPKTRATVLRAAHKLGYRPNGLAQAMKAGRFNALSIIVGGQNRNHGFGWMPAAMLHGIELEAAEADLSLHIAALRDEQLADESAMPRILRQWCSDGLLMNYIVEMPDKVAEVLRRTRVPTVYLNVDQPTNCVRPDDYAAAVMATEKLLEVGHRRIMYVGTNQGGGHYSQTLRLAGYRQVMRQAGLPEIEAGVDDYFRGTMGLAIESQVKHFQPTAILAYSGTGSVRVKHTLESMSFHVPRDISIVTFSDPWFESTAGQPYTAVHMPFVEVGRKAVSQLCQLIDTKQDQPAKIISGTWFEGHSLAPPHVAKDW